MHEPQKDFFLPKPLSAVLFLITSNWKESKLFISGRMDRLSYIDSGVLLGGAEEVILMLYG